MKKIFLILMTALCVGIVTPQIVRALSNVWVAVQNRENDQYIDYGALALFSLDTNALIGNFAIHHGFAFIDELPGFDGIDQVNALVHVFASGYYDHQSVIRLRSGRTTHIQLDPLPVYCDDRVCHRPEEDLNNCPADCSVCGDNVCSIANVYRPNYFEYRAPEHRVNCPTDCDVRLFVRGDVNGDNRVTADDANKILNGTYDLRCPDSADANDDGAVDISDGIKVYHFLYLGQPIPYPSPYRRNQSQNRPGYDPTSDSLRCDHPPAR